MLYAFRDLVSLFNDLLSFIKYLVVSTIEFFFNFGIYMFDNHIKGKNFVGFLLLHPIVLFWLSDEAPFLMFFFSVLAFLLYYRLFLVITIVNSYAVMYMMSFAVNNIANVNLHHYQAHPFTLMLVLPLIYIVLFLIILPNKYNRDFYLVGEFDHLKLFQMVLINFVVTYSIAFIYIVNYKFLHIVPAADVLFVGSPNCYDLERISLKDELFCYNNFVSTFSHPALFFVFYFDNLGVLFMGLSLLLIVLSFLFLWPTFEMDNNKTLYINLLLLLLVQLQGTFTAGSLLGFFVFFESLLIPMLIMIVIWGSKNNRQASNYLVFYTMFSAVPMFLAIVYIIHKTNLYTIPDLYYYITSSTDIRKTWTWTEQLTLWLAFFLGFAVKTPMVPFHIWLPKAHVDAPTVGSVILAGLLLKVGLVGFIRILYLLFPVATKFFAPYVAAIATVGVIYSSLITLRQIDMKRIIAYSSVAHMNMAMVSLCSLNPVGVYSSIYLMLSHGLIASGLFFLVGFLYNRFHVRSVYYYGGLATIMPVLGFFFFLFTLANMAFPLTSGFIGEFLLLLGISMNNFYIAFLNAFSMLLTTVYSVLLFGRVFLGELKPWFENMIQHEFEKQLKEGTKEKFGVIAYYTKYLKKDINVVNALKDYYENTSKKSLIARALNVGSAAWNVTYKDMSYTNVGIVLLDILTLRTEKYWPKTNTGLIQSVSIFDIYYYELIIAVTLFAGIVYLGIYPQIIFTYLHHSMVLTETITSMMLPYPVEFYSDKIHPNNFSFYIRTIFIKI